MEGNKELILESFRSQRLAWWYNEFTKQWDVVYKIEPLSQRNSKYWIVADCNENYFAIDESNLHTTPPSDKLTVHKVIRTVLNALDVKFAQTAVCLSVIIVLL